MAVCVIRKYSTSYCYHPAVYYLPLTARPVVCYSLFNADESTESSSTQMGACKGSHHFHCTQRRNILEHVLQ